MPCPEGGAVAIGPVDGQASVEKRSMATRAIIPLRQPSGLRQPIRRQNSLDRTARVKFESRRQAFLDPITRHLAVGLPGVIAVLLPATWMRAAASKDRAG